MRIRWSNASRPLSSKQANHSLLLCLLLLLLFLFLHQGVCAHKSVCIAMEEEERVRRRNAHTLLYSSSPRQRVRPPCVTSSCVTSSSSSLRATFFVLEFDFMGVYTCIVCHDQAFLGAALLEDPSPENDSTKPPPALLIADPGRHLLSSSSFILSMTACRFCSSSSTARRRASAEKTARARETKSGEEEGRR